MSVYLSFKSVYEFRSTTDELLVTSALFDGENGTIFADHERDPEACEGPLTKKECLDFLKTI